MPYVLKWAERNPADVALRVPCLVIRVIGDDTGEGQAINFPSPLLPVSPLPA